MRESATSRAGSFSGYWLRIRKKLHYELAKQRTMWQISPPAQSEKLLTAIAPLFPLAIPPAAADSRCLLLCRVQVFVLIFELEGGFEPSTYGLRNRCSTS